jgi:hypothetical protein
MMAANSSKRWLLALLASVLLAPPAWSQPCGIFPSEIFRNGVEADDPMTFPDVSPVTLPGDATPLSLTLDFPPTGADIVGTAVTLGGAWSGPPNTAVTIDGRPARVAPGRWWLPALALEPGSNAIDIVATASNGSQQQVSRILTSDPDSAPRPRVEVEQAGVYAPSQTGFRVLLPVDSQVTEVRADFNADGMPEHVGPPQPGPYGYVYRQPGAYTARFTLVEDGEPDVVLEVPVVVSRLGETRATLCKVFDTLKQRLAKNDIAAALQLLHPEIRDFYQGIWSKIDDLPAVATQLGDIADGRIGFAEAEYLIVREEEGQLYGYRVQFSRDPDGVWKISAM